LSRHFSEAYVQAQEPFLWSSMVRTPGYPFFCYVWLQLFGDSLTSILIAQNVISLICVAVVFVWTRRRIGPAAANWAAVLVALDPLAITYSNLIRNEALFSLALLLAVWLWCDSLGRPRLSTVAASGLFFGLATLIRPITTFVLLFVIPADMWLRRRNAGLVMSVCMIAAFAVPVGAWVARNQAVAGQAVVSSIAGYNVAYFRYAGAIAEERGEARNDVVTRLQLDTVFPFEPRAKVTDVSPIKSSLVRLLIDHPYGVIMGAVKGCLRLLLGPGTADFNLEVHGDLHRTDRVVTATLSAYLAAVYVGLFTGIIVLVRKRAFETLLPIGAIALYLVIVSSGPESYSRFRSPLMPLFAVVAGTGLAALATRNNRFLALR
jgi:4-amino-4-deoxy-L-arabinose transferase-like glycosyltransferase